MLPSLFTNLLKFSISLVLLSANLHAADIRLLDVNTNNTLATCWTVNNISPGNDRIMIWMVSHENNGLRPEQSVVLGGQPFTKLAQVSVPAGDVQNVNLDLWYLLEAGIQARTDNSVCDDRIGASRTESECKMVLVYENVNQTNPFNDFAFDSTGSPSSKRPMQVDIDVLAGGMVIALFGEGSVVTSTWNNGFLKTSEVVSTTLSLMAASGERLFATTQTATVSVDVSPELNRHALIGASLNPSAPLGPQPPVLAFIGSKNVPEGSNLNFLVTAFDPNGTTPTLSTSALPIGASFVDNFDGSGTFDWTPLIADTGIYSVTFFADDGALTDSEVVTITVSEAASFLPINLLDINTNNSLATSWTVNNISPGSNRMMLWMVSHENAGVRSLDSVKLGGQKFTKLAQVPTSDGNLNLDLWYLMEAGLQARTSDDIINYRSGASSSEVECKTVLVYENVDQGNPFNGFAVDSTRSSSSKRPIVVNVDVLAGGMAIGLYGEGSVVSTIWNNGFTRQSEVTESAGGLTGSSGDLQLSTAQTVSVSVDVTVRQKRHALIGAAMNPAVPFGPQPPVLASIGPKSGIENVLLSFTVSASDPDGTTPSLSASPLPAGATFTDNFDGTGSFDWTPTPGQAGLYNITFFASDSSLTDSEVVAITINATNQPPVLATIGPKSGDEGTLLSFGASATDADGTIPVLSTSTLPAGATFTDSSNGSGGFSWTPTFAQAGVYAVTFYAADGFDTDSISITITVNNVNRAPVLAAIGAKTVAQNVALTFGLTASDPDGTIPALLVSSLPTGASFIDHSDGTATFDWTPVSTDIGTHNVLFIASDGTLDDSELVVITVVDSIPTTLPISLVGSWTTGLSHTVNMGNNRLLLFTVGWEEKQNLGDRPISSVSYGSIPLTKVVRQSQSAWQGVEIWYLNEADILTATSTSFSVIWTSGTPGEVVLYAAATYADVDQTTPIVDFSSSATPNGQPNPLTTTVNVVTDGYSVAVASHGKGNGGFVWNNGWTSRTEQLSSKALVGTGDHAETTDGTAAASVSKLMTTANRFVLAAVSLAPASTAKSASAAAAATSSSEEQLPDDYRLYHNYPNPFNPTTTIGFSLPISGHVELTIYNVLGQRVATPVDRYLEAGHHTVIWNAEGYASGFYLYRIEAGEFQATRKMILLK